MKFFKDTNNEVYAYELDGSQDHLIGVKVQITREEVDAIIEAKNISNFNALTYDQKRASEYPNIKDQLDTIFHLGLDVWKQQIQAIKDKYPKE
jgi:hypothetical protein